MAASILSSTHIPRDVFLQIVSYCSPQEKRVAACVCKTFKAIFEDPKVLCEDFYGARDQLSMRQLAILVEDFTLEEHVHYSFLDHLVEKIEDLPPERYPVISEKSFVRVLESAKRVYIQGSTSIYLKTLAVFDRLFRKSPQYKQEKAIDILCNIIQQTKYFNVNREFTFGFPITKAADLKNENLIRALVKAGASVNSFTSQHTNPLCAILSGVLNKWDDDRLLCLIALLELGVSPEATEGRGFFNAIVREDEEAVRVFCKFKTNVNMQRAYPISPTALFVALEFARSLPIVKILMEHGADPTIRNSYNETPADVAREMGLDDIADYLDQEIEKRKKL